MRLITILFFVGIMHVSAATYGQKVSLNQKNMTIKEVFKEIKRQTGYDVLWQTGKLDANRRVNMHFNDAALAQIMRACLKNDQFDFEILDESIIIKEKPALSEAANTFVNQDSTVFKGMVADEKGRPLTGATVKVKGGTKTTFTTTKGTFAIYGPKKGALIISYIGYSSKEITLTGLDPRLQIEVKLIPGANDLGEVNVVSTGYQDLPKERATGSFEVITKEQLQHSTDPNLLRRLEGITTSMNFNNQLISSNSSNLQNVGGTPSPLTNLTIRGANSFATAVHSFDNQSGVPLVVIDGIAIPYSIDLINPEDVESITILKDAAAASIWGSRAANGVIVVKTKRGAYNKPVNVSFNSNFNATDKLDLFYKKTMSVSDYIDAEIRRFNNNNVNLTKPVVGRPQRNISPVDEILGSQKSGLITADQATDQLNALRGNDVRDDYTKYFLRNSLRQSYSLAIDGGSQYVAYRLSLGYDKTLNNTQNSDFNRMVLNYNISVHPFKNLEINGNISYSLQHNNDQAVNNRITGVSNSTFYPYTRLADDQGNFLSIPKTYRPAWVDLLQSTYGDNVSLNYVPLQDINEGYSKTNNHNVNLALTTSYKFNSDFSANITYNYSNGRNELNTLYRQNSFYMRDLINLFTSPPGATDQYGNDISFKRNLPLGGQLQTYLDQPVNQTLRGQLNYNKTWNDKHVLSAIAGIDIAQSFDRGTSNIYYGYNEDNLSNTNSLIYNTLISPLLYTTSSGAPFSQLPGLPSSFTYLKIRTVSSFSNLAYTYDRKYTISGSVRKDASSEFGIGTNQKGTPFWSTGASWNISNENFYHFDFLPRFQFRATYGYNGNVNPVTSVNPLINYITSPGDNGLLYAELNGSSVSNSKLRPEKTGILNLGLDFGLRNNRISGSIEYYDKRTSDLINTAPLDPTTGYSAFNINSANIHGWGADFTLNSINLRYGLLSWTSNFLFSYNREQVTKLYVPSAQNALDVIAGTTTSAYNVGYDLSRVFAFRWAGLDPATGDPRGYYNNQIVTISNTAQGNTALNNIENSPLTSAHYFGSAVPVYFGSLRNSFNYGRFTMSINILYKLGYYFRRTGDTGPVSYANLFNNRTLLGGEYESRWQKPGDELITNVPSLTFPVSSTRDVFYALSDINVLKGDHVRLQEINLSYGFGNKKWFLKNPRLYLNISNLGIIWRANKLGLDPDTFDYPIPKTYSFGFSTNF